jgi:hypothetical protein
MLQRTNIIAAFLSTKNCALQHKSGVAMERRTEPLFPCGVSLVGAAIAWYFNRDDTPVGKEMS